MKRTDRDGAPLEAVDADEAWQEATESEVPPDGFTHDALETATWALRQLEEARERWKQEAHHWSAVRAAAVQELKQGRTWAQVAELLGASEATAWNIAHPK